MTNSRVVFARVTDLLVSSGARAAGCWRREDDHLVQVAFVPAPDLNSEVAARFAAATRALPLDRLDLGVVRASVSGGAVVSIASELPADRGSGYWLRAFGAACSVAVALADDSGATRSVLSIALPEVPERLEPIIERIRRASPGVLAP